MSEPAAAVAWALPRVDGPVVGRRRLSDLDELEREAWQTGYDEGRGEGRSAAAREQQHLADEMRVRVARLDAILELQSRPLAELDAAVYRQLAELAGAIARQVVRRELRAQPEEIVAVIRECLGLLPAAAREVRIVLHPEDAQLVRERLVEPGQSRAWTLAEDPVVTRGGCRVETQYSSIDAQVEARLGAAIAAVLGDERGAEAGGGA
jgi:flagellar assembly protein FliH